MMVLPEYKTEILNSITDIWLGSLPMKTFLKNEISEQRKSISCNVFIFFISSWRSFVSSLNSWR